MIIGLYLRHIKAYKGINYIPISISYNFITYIGENGSGKSSILESLNYFFNDKICSINKSALADGITTKNNEPFIVPIFLIDKNKVSKHKKEFERLSNYFWYVNAKNLNPRIHSSMKDFFDLRDNILINNITSETHYLIVMGEIFVSQSMLPNFASFTGEEKFLKVILEKNDEEYDKISRDTHEKWKEEYQKIVNQKKWKEVLGELKSLYSYVYLPVELEIESFTKIETDEMQKIFDKKLKIQIEEALKNVNLNNTDGVNKRLDSFIGEIEGILDNMVLCQESRRIKSEQIN